MKIYFAGSIRGGREDQGLYLEIIRLLNDFGTVLTEHIGDKSLTTQEGSSGKDVNAIYKEDMTWLKESDVMVAEVTQPSLGVGYELGQAEAMDKRILCLYRPNKERSLSAMIAGNPYKKMTIKEYRTLENIQPILQDYFS